METFIKDHTNSGILYHGTPLEAVSPIIRGGFLISGTGQGAAAYGSGVYSTKNREEAEGFSTDGVVLELQLDQSRCYKVIDLTALRPFTLRQLEAEAKEKKFFDLNELLKIAASKPTSVIF